MILDMEKQIEFERGRQPLKIIFESRRSSHWSPPPKKRYSSKAVRSIHSYSHPSSTSTTTSAPSGITQHK